MRSRRTSTVTLPWRGSPRRARRTWCGRPCRRDGTATGSGASCSPTPRGVPAASSPTTCDDRLMPELDVLTIGRVSVDLYSDTPGAGFMDPQRFEKSIGGTATNVAVAAARLGHRTAVLTKVGDDPFGDYVIAKLQSFGVDTAFVGRHPTLRTPLAFASLTPPEDPQLLFYREPAAPDMQLEPGDADP